MWLWLCLVTAAAAPMVEVPDSVPKDAHTTYTISTLTPKVFVKTDEFELNVSSCMQYSYNLTQSRVKLRAYMCLMSEGGYCVMNKHAYPEKAGCLSLRPWYLHNQPFSFYFTLERRERKYGPAKAHLRNKKVKRANGRVDATPIGELKLEGILPCVDACSTRSTPS